MGRVCKRRRVGLCLALSVAFLMGCQQEAETMEEQDTETVIEATEVGIDVNAALESEVYGENSEATEVVKETSDETEDSEVTILMVGDILLHTSVAESGLKEDGTYTFSHLFEHVKEDIEAADLALVNQEVIIGGEELGVSGYPCFNAPYALGDALVETGFDVILHATNHALDKGKNGVTNCLNFWNENYPEIGVVGINGSQEAQDEIYICEKNGIRIAVLNYTYGTNGINLPSDMPYAVNLLEENQVVKDLQNAEELADFTIVCPHWGTEYSLSQTAEQEKWAEIFYENGADLVIGTHPHVIEPIEWYGENDEMLIYYSLGNFVNWTSGTGTGAANRMVGGMAEITIEKNDAGEVEIMEYGVEPIVCHLENGFEGVTVYRLKDYTEELAAENQMRNQDAEFSLEYCQNLCEEIWGNK